MNSAAILGGIMAGLLVLAAAIVFLLAIRTVPVATGRLIESPGVVPYSISVAADADASGPPDVAYVTLGVDTPAATAQEATDANARTMSAVTAAVKAQGVPDKDVRTQDFSVTPVYAATKPGENSAPSITGYRVRNTLRITVENVQNVGKVLDAGLGAHANSAVGVAFGIKDTTPLQQQALKDAFQRARSKAEAIAAASGVKLSGAYTISESSAPPPRPIAVAAVAPASAATPIESGQLTVTGHVQVVFQYS